jgi:hypothetical protein
VYADATCGSRYGESLSRTGLRGRQSWKVVVFLGIFIPHPNLTCIHG